MNFSLYNITKAMQSFKNAIAGSNYMEDEKLKTFTVDIQMIEEDPGNGVMVSVMRLSTEGTMPANSYQGPAHVKFVMEIFPDDEKKPPKITVTTSRDVT